MNNLAPYQIPYLKHFKNGTSKLVKVRTIKWFTSPHRTIHVTREGEHQPIKYEAFNPGSRDHIKKWMYEDHGFLFPYYTKAGNAKVDPESLEGMDHPAGKLLKRYLKAVKDQSQVGGSEGGWLSHYNEKTHSIHHKVDTIGANTHRATHSKPNLAQVPANHEFREVFSAPPGRVVVGADLANIEVRTLAHYLYQYDDGLYADAVLSKDMHWYHAKLAGFWTIDDRDWPDDDHADERTSEMKEARTKSKAFFFSWLYGSGDTVRGNSLWTDGCLTRYTDKEYKMAKKRVESRIKKIDGKNYFPLKKDQYVLYDEILILQTIYGKRISDTFLEKVKGIKLLIKACQKESEEYGVVTAIDGRKLNSRSPHSALNLLLQGSAGVIAKKWMVNYHQLAKDREFPHGIRWSQMGFIHDEYQCQCDEEYAETLGEIMVDGCAMIQSQFNMALPIKADYMIGHSWADTH